MRNSIINPEVENFESHDCNAMTVDEWVRRLPDTEEVLKAQGRALLDQFSKTGKLTYRETLKYARAVGRFWSKNNS